MRSFIAAVGLVGVLAGMVGCMPFPSEDTGPASSQRLEERGHHTNRVERRMEASSDVSSARGFPVDAEGSVPATPVSPNSRWF